MCKTGSLVSVANAIILNQLHSNPLPAELGKEECGADQKALQTSPEVLSSCYWLIHLWIHSFMMLDLEFSIWVWRREMSVFLLCCYQVFRMGTTFMSKLYPDNFSNVDRKINWSSRYILGNKILWQYFTCLTSKGSSSQQCWTKMETNFHLVHRLQQGLVFITPNRLHSPHHTSNAVNLTSSILISDQNVSILKTLHSCLVWFVGWISRGGS